MNNIKINHVNNILKEKGTVTFKMYSMDYVIDVDNDNYIIYSKVTPEFKKKYKTIKSLFQNYKIYGESLMDNTDKIEMI